MKILVASSNKGKIKEIKEFFEDSEIYALDEVLEPFDIEENGKNFKENAFIKARAVYEKLCSMKLENEYCVLSDDSGISVDALNGKPGIYSARFAGIKASDAQNRAKLIASLDELNLKESLAFYTACIALVSKFGEFSAHGFMHGKVINQEKGQNGFGYDFLFIPNGYDKTVGELSSTVKKEISHRSKALNLSKYLIKNLQKVWDKK